MAQRNNIPPTFCVLPQFCNTTLSADYLNQNAQSIDAALSMSKLKACINPSMAGGVMQPFLGYGYAWQVPQQGYSTSGGFVARQNEYRPFAHFSGSVIDPNSTDPMDMFSDMWVDFPVIAHSWEDSYSLTIEAMRSQRTDTNIIAGGSANSLVVAELSRTSHSEASNVLFYYNQFFRVEYYMNSIGSPLVLVDEANNATDFPLNTARKLENNTAYDFRGPMPAGYAPPAAGSDRTDRIRVIIRNWRGSNPNNPFTALENIYFVFGSGNAGSMGGEDYDGIKSLSFSMYKSPC